LKETIRQKQRQLQDKQNLSSIGQSTLEASSTLQQSYPTTVVIVPSKSATILSEFNLFSCDLTLSQAQSTRRDTVAAKKLKLVLHQNTETTNYQIVQENINKSLSHFLAYDSGTDKKLIERNLNITLNTKVYFKGVKHAKAKMTLNKRKQSSDDSETVAISKSILKPTTVCSAAVAKTGSVQKKKKKKKTVVAKTKHVNKRK